MLLQPGGNFIGIIEDSPPDLIVRGAKSTNSKLIEIAR